MKYLLDTCVISEMVRPQPNPQAINWLRQQSELDLYVSVLTFGEIDKGVEKAVDPERKKKLLLWLETDLRQRFGNRVVAIDLAVATMWGRVQGVCEKKGQGMPAIDSLIAVSALVNNCTVVTRNTGDMVHSGAALLNPWQDKF